MKQRPLSPYYTARLISMNDLIFILFWREAACVCVRLSGTVTGVLVYLECCVKLLAKGMMAML